MYPLSLSLYIYIYHMYTVCMCTLYMLCGGLCMCAQIHGLVAQMYITLTVGTVMGIYKLGSSRKTG